MMPHLHPASGQPAPSSGIQPQAETDANSLPHQLRAGAALRVKLLEEGIVVGQEIELAQVRLERGRSLGTGGERIYRRVAIDERGDGQPVVRSRQPPSPFKTASDPDVARMIHGRGWGSAGAKGDPAAQAAFRQTSRPG